MAASRFATAFTVAELLRTAVGMRTVPEMSNGITNEAPRMPVSDARIYQKLLQ
jgi:hypothetical protein